MSAADPFKGRFEVFGHESKELVEGINEKAYQALCEALRQEPGGGGQVILLKAPRAGYGKTFLLNRVARTLRESHHFSKVELFGGRRLEAAQVLESLLRSLCQSVDRPGGLTELDLIARKVLAKGLEPLVHTGEVPAQDRAVALAALRTKPVETFDFHHEGAVTAHWTRANIEVLGPRLTSQLASLSGSPLKETAYWVELLFRYASTSPETADRTRLLFETIFGTDPAKASPSGAADSLLGLCALASVVCRIVFIIDETEGLSTNPQDALEIASFVTGFAQAAPRTAVVLSLNEDVWETAFEPRLPGGLEDRLTENEVCLKPMTRSEAEELVRRRAGKDAERVLAGLDWGDAPLSARQILKRASAAWTGEKSPAKAAPAAKEKSKPEAAPAAKATAPEAKTPAPSPAADTTEKAVDPKPAAATGPVANGAPAKDAAPAPDATPNEPASGKAPDPADKESSSLLERIQAVFGKPESNAEPPKSIFEKAKAQPSPGKEAPAIGEPGDKPAAADAATKPADPPSPAGATPAAKKEGESEEKPAGQSPFGKVTPPPMKPLVPGNVEPPKTESKEAPAKPSAPPAAVSPPPLNPFQQQAKKDEPKSGPEPAAKSGEASSKPAAPANPFQTKKPEEAPREEAKPAAASNPFQAAPKKDATPAQAEPEVNGKSEEAKPQPAANPFRATPKEEAPAGEAKPAPETSKAPAAAPPKEASNPFRAAEEKAPAAKEAPAKAPDKDPANPFVPVEPKAKPAAPATSSPAAPQATNPFARAAKSAPAETTKAETPASPFSKTPAADVAPAKPSPFSPAAKPGDPASDPPAGTPAAGVPARKPTQLPPKRSELVEAGAKAPPKASQGSPFSAAAPATDSPFKPVSAPADTPSASPFKAANPQGAPAESKAPADPPTAELSDENAAKVDQLLKQFKERYGRE